MKKIDRLLLRSFLGPLALTFAVSVFVLLMQFIWKYIDDLVGKGLPLNAIAELLFYASATFVPMALPIAVLFASIMTMGNFGEKYELVAMKAGGISVRRAMMPMAGVAVVLTVAAFLFANHVMPVAMLRYRSILISIAQKKPALNIPVGEYYHDIDGYVIRVGEKDPDGLTMHDIVIYDHTDVGNTQTVITAANGTMQTSPDERYLIFTLNNGHTYTESTRGADYYTRPLLSMDFSQQVLTFDVSSFAFNRAEQMTSSTYHLLTVKQLAATIRGLEGNFDERCGDFRNLIYSYLPAYNQIVRIHNDSAARAPAALHPGSISHRLDTMPHRQRVNVTLRARNVARQSLESSASYNQILRGERLWINKHHIEWQKRYTLSLACLLLFLVGAPFGSIVRKGGLGLPLVASVAFFVAYYVVGMIGEKAVRESALGPEGMWVSTLFMLPIGIVLTLEVTTDSRIFDSATWHKLFKHKKSIDSTDSIDPVKS
ncbi:MAG: LptF/LptG family permease [Bacteroidales bacterium]|nr:LptF/LptG family permease [Bacteroidales bacterium]